MYWSDGSLDSVTIHSGSGGECIQVDLGEVCGISGDLTCDRSLDAFDMVLCRRVLAD